MKVCSICQLNHDESVDCFDRAMTDTSEIVEVRTPLVPGYHVTRSLSSRPNAQLYKAREISSSRSCLIKIVAVDAESSEHFLRDAETAAGVFHPAIADIYETGRLDDGRCFVVSEDIDGKTLREILDHVGTPGLLPSIEIIRQAAEALHALHLSGMVHGAVNPKNIVISKDSGRTVVRLQHTDFGCVEQRAIVSNRIAIDNELESLQYFSPEQSGTESSNLRSDIYSLGIVLYEMLAEQPPFRATTAVGLIHKHRNETPPEIRIENFNLRMLVTHALSEALQKNARLRQSSANLLARQLRHIEQLATHTSTPPPAGVVPKPVRAVATKPVPVSRVEPEPERVPAMIVEEPPLIISDPVVATPTIEATVPEPVIPAAPEPKHIFVAPRSRLKVWRKKLHSMAARVASEKTSEAASIFEAARNKMADQVSIKAERLDSANVAVPAQRRKIEWETPDDDLPSMADVLEARAEEALPAPELVTAGTNEATALTIEEPTACTTAEPTRREQIQVPFVERLPEKKAIPVAVPSEAKAKGELQRVMAEPKRVTAAPLAVEPPIKVEARAVIESPPEIQSAPVIKPTVQVQEVTAKPQEPTVDLPKPKKRVVKKAPRKNPVVQKQDAPAIVAVAAPEPIAPRMYADTARPAREPRPVRQRSGLGFKVNLADLEEITLVRPPNKRIKIDWERTARRADVFNVPVKSRPSRSPVFSPTILGSATPVAMAEPTSTDQTFLGYSPSDARELVRRRPFMIAGGCIAVLALLLFGSDSVTRYFQSWSLAGSVTMSDSTSKARSAGTSEATIPEPPPPVPMVAAERAPKNSEKPAPVASSRPTSEKARTAAAAVPEKTPPSRATKERKTPVVQKPKEAPVKAKLATPVKANPSTRPRIVATQD